MGWKGAWGEGVGGLYGRQACLRKNGLNFAASYGQAAGGVQQPPEGLPPTSRDTARAMSQENVEIARRSFEAFNRTFKEGTPDLYETLDPEVEWVPMSALLMRTSYHGHDGVRQWIEEMKRDWTTFEVRPERFVDVGDEGVLVLGAWRAQGRKGEALLDIPQAAWLVQYQKGLLVRLRTFTDRAEALEAAGLEE